jgi:multiple sugar transport system substrate-binding protein
MNFFRTSHFSSPVVRAFLPNDYLDIYQQTIAINFPELRIPGTAEYYDALDVNVQKALSGEISAQEALDATAATWNEITDKFGREDQMAVYRATMGIE